MRWILPYIKPKAMLYNIGAGFGDFNHLATRAGLRILACEPDPDAFGIAAVSRPGSNCEVLPLGLEDLRERAHPPTSS